MIKPFRYILLSLLLLLPGAGTMQAQTFDRGDVNGDGIITVADIQALANYLRTGNFNIVTRTLSFADNTTAVNKSYGDAAFTVAATPSKGADDGDITYTSSVTGVATVNETTGQVTIVAAGTTVITANISAGTTYGEAEASYTLTVSQAAISPTVTLADFTYGSTGTPSVSGNSGSGDVTYYYKTGEADWTTTQPTAAGIHQVKAQIAATANYLAGETAPVSFSILQAAATITAETSQSATYNQSAQALTASVDNGSITITYYSDAEHTQDATTDAPTDAGTYYAVVSQSNSNYASTPVNVTYTINPIVATLAWINTSFTYDGSEHAPSCVVFNLLQGDACTVTVGGGQTDVGNYTATATALSNGNYSLPNSPTTSFTINTAAATITAAASQSVTYSGSAQAPTATPSAGSVSITYYSDAEHTQDATTDAPTDAGTYYAVLSQSNSNYTSDDVNVTFTISQKEVTVSGITASDKTYDGTTAATLDCSSAVFSGIVGGDALTVTATGTFSDVNAGDDKTVTISGLTLGGSSVANYTLAAEGQQSETTASISKAAGSITLSATAGSVTAGSAATITVSSSHGGTLSASATSGNTDRVSSISGPSNSQFTVTTNGTAAGSVTVTVTSAATTNYNEATATFTLTINALYAASLSELKTRINNSEDCSGYIGWEVNSSGAIASSGVSGTKIGYIGYISTSNVDTGVSGSRILVIASADASTSATWGSYGTSRSLTADNMCGYTYTNTLQDYGSSAHPAAYAAWNYSASKPSGASNWFLPTKAQLTAIVSALGGYSTFKTKVGWASASYWSSTEYNANVAYFLLSNGGWNYSGKGTTSYVRSCFAY